MGWGGVGKLNLIKMCFKMVLAFSRRVQYVLYIHQSLTPSGTWPKSLSIHAMILCTTHTFYMYNYTSSSDTFCETPYLLGNILPMYVEVLEFHHVFRTRRESSDAIRLSTYIYFHGFFLSNECTDFFIFLCCILIYMKHPQSRHTLDLVQIKPSSSMVHCTLWRELRSIWSAL